MAKVSTLVIGKDRPMVLMQTPHSPLVISLKTKKQLTSEEMTKLFYDICSLIIVVLVRNTLSVNTEYHS